MHGLTKIAKLLLATALTVAALTACEVDEPGTAADREVAAQEAEKAAATEQPAAPAEEPESTEPEMTTAQKNAVGTAADYLDYGAFSRDGLIKQLKFEGYSKKDATFAVDYVDPDWKVQAAKSAKDYLEYGTFSRKGLIQQLEFEGYTTEQATYAVDKAGL